MTRLVADASVRALEFEEEIELIVGSPPRWCKGASVFISEAERREAYEGHRGVLGGWLGGHAGNRSQSFWQYDTDLPEEPKGDERLLWLAEHGHLLDPAELSEIAQTSKAAQDRIGTAAETSFDPKTATLYDRVCEALP